MEKKIQDWFEKNNIYVIAYVIPFIIMLVIFMVAKIYPFGDRSFLHIDMYHQYFPFLTDFYRAVKGTNVAGNLTYSWNAGIGSNYTALYAYYLATPTNWLSLLWKEKSLMEFISYMVIVKIGGCGASFAYYLAKKFDRKDLSVVLFSTFYALSGYMAAYNWDVMWLDPILLAPLVILGLERLANGEGVKLYTIALGLAIFSNYYLCIMICIYVVLYFFVVLLAGAKNKLAALIDFAVYSLIAGCMGAVLIIPEVLALQLSKFTNTTFPATAKTYFTVFDVLGRHFMDVAVETGLDHWPNIYCSVAVLVLFPLYVMCKKVPLREKACKVALLAFMLISFTSNVMAYLWHGFNYPDSLPSRQSFLYIILLLTVCYEAYLNIREFSNREIGSVCMGVLCFTILAQKLIDDDAITGRSYLLSLIMLAVYLILMCLGRREKKTEGLIIVLLLAVCIEAGVNTKLTSVPTVSRTNYMSKFGEYNEIYDEYNELADGKFYRFDRQKRNSNNDSMFQNYPGLSMFSSTSNGLVNYFYQDYGMRASKVFYCSDGLTPFTRALLSAKYLMSKEGNLENTLMTKVDERDEISLYSYDLTLPLGYVIHDNDTRVSELVNDKDTAFEVFEKSEEEKPLIFSDDITPVERQNELAHMLGATDDLYIYIDSESGAQAYFEIPEDGYYYVYCNTKKIKTLKADTDAGELSFEKMKNPYIADMGYNYAGSMISLKDEDGANLKAKLYRFNVDVYEELVNKLGHDTVSFDSFKATKQTGTVTASSDGYLVFSIPYDPGFKVYVDGNKVESELFLEMMLAVPVSEGEHRIELKYTPQGLYAGLVVTLMAVFGFVAICIYDAKKKTPGQTKKDNGKSKK